MLKKKQGNRRLKDKLSLKERRRWLRLPELLLSTKISLQPKKQQKKRYLDSKKSSEKKLKEKLQH